jgi:poly(A) polymerase Pap1
VFLWVAHPYIKGFETTYECKNQKFLDHMGSGGKESTFVDDGTGEIFKGEDGQPGPRMMEMTTFWIGLSTNTKRLDFGWETSDFQGLIYAWDSYDKEKMAVSTNFRKREELPDVVFDGKPRPVFEKKKKRKRKAAVVQEPVVVVEAKKVKVDEPRADEPMEEKSAMDIDVGVKT